MKSKEVKKEYVYVVGRRKTSSARVRLYKGDNQHEVNGMPIGKYFPGKIMQSIWEKPFRLTDTIGKFYITVKVIGGGRNGQLEAVVHGIAKALNLSDREKFRALLKADGLLTRDARKRQRRMIGTGGKARRKKQSPKR